MRSLAAALETKRSLYWQWAFESPPEVKAILRKHLGEDNMPQACANLFRPAVLQPQLPDYNSCGYIAGPPAPHPAADCVQRDGAAAGAAGDAFHAALQAGMRQSSYWPLLRHVHGEESAHKMHMLQQPSPASPSRRCGPLVQSVLV